MKWLGVWKGPHARLVEVDFFRSFWKPLDLSGWDFWTEWMANLFNLMWEVSLAHNLVAILVLQL